MRLRNRSIAAIACIALLPGCSRDEYIVDERFIDPVEPFSCERTIFPDDSIKNTHPIAGYSDKISYLPGETMVLMVHCLAPAFTVMIQRFGQEETTIWKSDAIQGQVQDYDPYSYSWGCEWTPSVQYTLPTDLTSGMYAAHLQSSDGGSFYVTFVVKRKPANRSKIAVLASTNTWQAYNHWGGVSFYVRELDDDVPSTSIVSFHRPNPVAAPVGNKGHLAGAELHLLRWLEAQGYDYDLIADSDLHTDRNALKHYEVVLLNTHSEYWTREMLNHLESYHASGGDIMYLSGNGLYWRVALACDRIEVRRGNEAHKYSNGVGGQWRELSRPEAALLGVAYNPDGYDTYAPYEVLAPDHWVFESVDLAAGDVFGTECLNGDGASGHETDKITGESPSRLVHLAKGTNPDGGGADMVYIGRQNGSGRVFSVGSITYCGSLPVDSNVSAITETVLNRFIAN